MIIHHVSRRVLSPLPFKTCGDCNTVDQQAQRMRLTGGLEVKTRSHVILRLRAPVTLQFVLAHIDDCALSQIGLQIVV